MVKQSINSECLISDIINLIINGLNTHSYSYDELSRLQGTDHDSRMLDYVAVTPILV